MKKRSIATSALAMLLATTTFAPAAALAEYRCDSPSSTIDKRACDKAAEGPHALRTFVDRTRMIWGLDIWDYAPPEQQSATTLRAVERVLQVPAAPGQATVTAGAR